MHLNVTIKNVSWPHFRWAILYICTHTRKLIVLVEVLSILKPVYSIEVRLGEKGVARQCQEYVYSPVTSRV